MYCDFVVWSNNDILVEQIPADGEFFNAFIEDVQHFFVYAILPEIIGKWYTWKPVPNKERVVEIVPETLD